MLKKLALTAAVALLTACSSGDDNTTVAPPVITPPGGGVPGTPTGTTEGSWTGTNDFGTTYTIIDGNGAMYGFTDNGAGQFRSTFGNISGPLEQFVHRASDNATLGEAYTIVGDPGPAVTYTFSVSDGGQVLNNSGDAGAFSLALANVANLSIADIAGNWESRTAFCAACPLSVNLNILADGTLTGSSQFSIDGGDVTVSPLAGTVSGAGPFLGVQFTFNGDTRTGVLYTDAAGRLVMNTFGADAANGGNKSFSALFSR